MKIKQGDNVIVIAGKDRGKTGVVARALPEEEQVVVEGVNVQTRHRKPTQRGGKGQVIEKTMPIHVSNVMIVDAKTGTRSRIKIEKEGNTRVRIAKKSGTKID